MRSADTSVVVAAFASWHEHHAAARRALGDGLVLIEHCALETYSVLTRLPPPHRVAGDRVRDFLASRFPDRYLRLSSAAYRRFVLALPEHQLMGGAVYDALIAATAVAHAIVLVSADLRAAANYERYGVNVERI